MKYQHPDPDPHGKKEHLETLHVIERTGSALSLLGCIFIIATFCASRAFHKPVNRLVFYASFGNMLSNVATLMSQSYRGSPASVQCQFQAFLIQMFMPADAYWTLAMAVNVHLTFYRKFDADGLRKMEIPYLLLCYGIPFIPAFTYLWVESGWTIYGDATLWCWITESWGVLHIPTFYGPVWLSILITAIIYIRTGRKIYEKPRELQELDSLPATEDLSAENPNSGCGAMMTTDLSVTSERVEDAGVILKRSTSGESQKFGAAHEYYTVTITSEPSSSKGFLPSATCGFIPGAVPKPSSPSNLRFHHQRHVHQDEASQKRDPIVRRRAQERNRAAWSYTKCSILFFIALLVTWVPSSAHRVHDLIWDTPSVPLESVSAFVLPLQGLWRAVIYCFISWEECKQMCRNLFRGRILDTWRATAQTFRNGRPDKSQTSGRAVGIPEGHIPLSALTSRSGSTQQLIEREKRPMT